MSTPKYGQWCLQNFVYQIPWLPAGELLASLFAPPDQCWQLLHNYTVFVLSHDQKHLLVYLRNYNAAGATGIIVAKRQSMLSHFYKY
ncbi:MAG: hypothetical protein IPN14_08225 [Bacteroidetes bacterium]|nr:hypothetical protein [Bacteroidota bacterium]